MTRLTDKETAMDPKKIKQQYKDNVRTVRLLTEQVDRLKYRRSLTNSIAAKHNFDDEISKCNARIDELGRANSELNSTLPGWWHDK